MSQNDGDNDLDLVVDFWDKPFKIIKANSGGIRLSITNILVLRWWYDLYLLKNDCPHLPVYKIRLSNRSVLHDTITDKMLRFNIDINEEHHSLDIWITWFNDVICIGKSNGPPLLVYPNQHTHIDKATIGFVKFGKHYRSNHGLDCIEQSYSGAKTDIKIPKKVNGGVLKWVRMSSDDTLPIDALIGGFENEPIYVARAVHMGSLCPGKYLKSKKVTYVPWGHSEHAKKEFEVLCGYDAIWVNCKSGKIPDNAFIGGYSEVLREPLFIGRTWVRNHLIVGKVHLLYKTCYLPSDGKELERTDYEILVVGNGVSRSESRYSLCCMKMNMQPCL